jgi:glycosyltransferase involved in cell wall biosynthesis
MKKLSIAIPSYSMSGRGIEMLQHSLTQIRKQTYNKDDYEIIISDDSDDDNIKNAITSIPSDILNIKYVKNEGKKGIAGNLNNTIKNCEGELIHVLCQDDYFIDKNSIMRIVNNFDYEKKWMVSAYMHTKDRFGMFRKHIPTWNNKIYLENTIGTPSCLTILNNDTLLFDEELGWFVDCDYYYRLYQKYGVPKIVNELLFIQLLWEGQATNSKVDETIITKERDYIIQKHESKII